jgi:uncharacterized protein YjbI with pentapeptide repeats
LIIQYNQERKSSEKHINELFNKKAYNELFHYALNDCNLFVAVSIFKKLREIEGFMPNIYIDFWNDIESVILKVPEKPDKQLLFNTTILQGTHCIASKPWVSDDGLKLAFLFLKYTESEKSAMLKQLKIISFRPYNIQIIPINETHLGSPTDAILFLDDDFSYVFVDHEKTVYKYSRHDSSSTSCGSISSSVYYFDENKCYLYFFDRNEQTIKFLNIKTGECKNTNVKIDDINFTKNLKGVNPLKRDGDFVLTSKRYTQKIKISEIDLEKTRLLDILFNILLNYNSDENYNLDIAKLKKIMLSDLTFTGKKLSDINQKEISFLDAEIENTKLADIRFVSAKLSCFKMEKRGYRDFGSITLAESTINGKPLSESDISNFMLSDLEILGEKLGYYEFEGIIFTDEKLSDIKINGKKLLESNWKEIKVAEIRISKKKLGNLRLLGKKLSDVLPNNLSLDNILDNIRVERDYSKMLFVINGNIIAKSIEHELSFTSKGRFILNESNVENENIYVVEVMSTIGEILEFLVDTNNIYSDQRIQKRSKVFLSGNSAKGNYVQRFCLGNKFPILASYWAKQANDNEDATRHVIKLFSTNEYKNLFSFFAKISLDSINFIHEDNFLFIKTGQLIMNNIHVVSLNYIVTCAKTPITLDADDYLRIERLLTVYPENKQLQLFVKMIKYFMEKKPFLPDK